VLQRDHAVLPKPDMNSETWTGRDAILIELNAEYAEMAERRLHGAANQPDQFNRVS
jgi:hypothetical protein